MKVRVESGTASFGWVLLAGTFSYQIVAFFDHQYLTKKYSYIMFLYLHRDSDQDKVLSDTTTFSWVRSGVPLI